MHSRMSAPTTPEDGADIAVDLYPFLRKYKNGRIERFGGSTFVPASELPARATGVATRDVVIDPVTGVSARLFLNAAALATSRRTLPLIVYFHGGCFCTGSAFSKMFHRYAESLSARAGALVVSVDYRLAPEHPIPAAYDDAWAAFRWTASLSDPWLANHGDPTRVFLAGESAGANIAHNVASRAGSSSSPDGGDIEGLIVLQPFFWGVERLPFETDRRHSDGRHMFSPEKVDTFWPFLTAGLAGNDDPRLNPPAEQVASLPCRRAFVSVASEDLARDRGRRYAAWLDGHGEWCREVTLVESEGEDHAFHLYRPRRAAAVALMDSVVQFVNEEPNSVAKTTTLLHDATRRMCLAASASGSDKKICVSPRSMVRNALVVRPGKASGPRSFGLTIGYSRLASKLVRKEPSGAAVLARTVARVCL